MLYSLYHNGRGSLNPVPCQHIPNSMAEQYLIINLYYYSRDSLNPVPCQHIPNSMVEQYLITNLYYYSRDSLNPVPCPHPRSYLLVNLGLLKLNLRFIFGLMYSIKV